ncbi:MAG: tetratricopeptide repeat protein [Verrucomicrobia bacterium]|nr:tetratricopeptide repeat protein [Verrucomicrobiota bacterium]
MSIPHHASGCAPGESSGRRAGAFQGLDALHGRTSKGWKFAAALALSFAGIAAAETNAPAPTSRRAALCIGVRDPAAADAADRGPADAVRLGEAFRAAGFDPTVVLAGADARRDAVLSALCRLRASTRTGDTVVVAYTGPVRADTDAAGDVLFLGPADATDARDDLPLRGAIEALAARTGADLAVLVVGLPALGSRTGDAAPWRMAGTLPVALRSHSLLLSGARGQTTEFRGPRTLMAANLASELERGVERRADGVSLADWLRAAVRRVTLESGGRQSPEWFVAGSAPAVGPQAPATSAAAPDAVPDLAAIGAMLDDERAEDALAAGLGRAAALLDLKPPGSASDLNACLALLARAAERLGRSDLSIFFASERLRRTDEPRARAGLAHDLGRLLLRDGRARDAVAMHRQALHLANADAAGSAWLADALERSGDLDAAREVANAALDSARTAEGPDAGEAYAIAQEVLARVDRECGDAAASRAHFEKALEWRRKTAGDRGRLALLLREVGESRLLGGDPAGATAALREAIDLLAYSAGSQRPLAEANMILGDALAAAGEPGAPAAWMSALTKWTASSTSAPPARLLLSIGESLVVAGRFGEAVPHLTRALDAAGQEESASLLLRAHRGLSRAAAQAGDAVGALRHAQLALATAAGSPPATPREIAIACGDLASLHMQRGETQRAIEYGERAVAERTKAGLTNDASSIAIWKLVGEAYEASKSPAAAAAAWSNAVATLAQVEGASAPSVATTRGREGRAWLNAGRPELAIPTLEAAVRILADRGPEAAAVRAGVLLSLGEARQKTGDSAARATLESAVAVAASGGDACDASRAGALLLLARIAQSEARLFAARRLAGEAAGLFLRLNSPDVAEAERLVDLLSSALALRLPQGSHEEMPAFTAAESDYTARRADGTPR